MPCKLQLPSKFCYEHVVKYYMLSKWWMTIELAISCKWHVLPAWSQPLLFAEPLRHHTSASAENTSLCFATVEASAPWQRRDPSHLTSFFRSVAFHRKCCRKITVNNYDFDNDHNNQQIINHNNKWLLETKSSKTCLRSKLLLSAEGISNC